MQTPPELQEQQRARHIQTFVLHFSFSVILVGAFKLSRGPSASQPHKIGKRSSYHKLTPIESRLWRCMPCLVEKYVLTSFVCDRWFCGLRDDVYLNVNQLVNLLRCFDPDINWYIGRPSQAFDSKKMADGIEVRTSYHSMGDQNKF